MELHCLGSSSAGNAYHLKVATSAGECRILLECGFPYRTLVSKLTREHINVADIDYCFVTHVHNDHSHAIKELSERGIKCFATKDTLVKKGARGTALVHNRKIIIADGLVSVTPIIVEHDPETETFAFIIQSDLESILFITDCKYFTHKLDLYHFDYVFIECNYYEKQLYTLLSDATKRQDRVKCERLGRIKNTHMGLFATKKILKTLNHDKLKAIFLIHLSDQHANEVAMRNEVVRQVKCPVYICKKNGGLF